MATSKPILPSPRSNANEPPVPSPWTRQEVPEADYPGALRNTDPRSPSEASNVSPEPYPGSGQVNEPWQSAPTPAPRRLRRGQ
jgi:hypothetical protein